MNGGFVCRVLVLLYLLFVVAISFLFSLLYMLLLPFFCISCQTRNNDGDDGPEQLLYRLHGASSSRAAAEQQQTQKHMSLSLTSLMLCSSYPQAALDDIAFTLLASSCVKAREVHKCHIKHISVPYTTMYIIYLYMFYPKDKIFNYFIYTFAP